MDVTMESAPADKIRLFRAMFRGREDVYARRYVSAKSGKSGYSPVCAIEWTHGLCDKRKGCATCPNRRLEPISDAVIASHLRGADAAMRDFAIGVYPLLADDSVCFAAIDFDKASWRSDSYSVCETLKSLGLPIARERSRSGNGAHLWFFFESPQPARFVRDVLTYALTITMERNPEVGLSSYDRIFPNQDRLPKGGFGNLIALPLQGAPRRAGNSCFVDERLVGAKLESLRFAGELREEQRLAANALIPHEVGVLSAGTAFGKTVLAAWMIAERKVSTLVLVDRKELQAQWVARLPQFLEISPKEIGRIGGGKSGANGRLDVAVIQSLARMEDSFLATALKSYGQVIVDECHAISAPTFERVARAASAKYFLGLSATVIRKDGQHPLIEMACGPVRHRVDAKRMESFSIFRHVVRVRPKGWARQASAEGLARVVGKDSERRIARHPRNWVLSGGRF